MSIRIGSPQHRDLLCTTFLETHVAFEPESLPWPKLEPRYVELLRSFPFWSFALSMEQEAGRMITDFAQTIDDPLLRKAIDLQAYEESRHGRLLKYMLNRYEIDFPAVPLTNKVVGRDDFLTFGFSECTDSFIGFAGFALARAKGVFPDGLLDMFEQILYEEARHIVFFHKLVALRRGARRAEQPGHTRVPRRSVPGPRAVAYGAGCARFADVGQPRPHRRRFG